MKKKKRTLLFGELVSKDGSWWAMPPDSCSIVELPFHTHPQNRSGPVTHLTKQNMVRHLSFNKAWWPLLLNFGEPWTVVWVWLSSWKNPHEGENWKSHVGKKRPWEYVERENPSNLWEMAESNLSVSLWGCQILSLSYWISQPSQALR
jgi:hypothetical protein